MTKKKLRSSQAKTPGFAAPSPDDPRFMIKIHFQAIIRATSAKEAEARFEHGFNHSTVKNIFKSSGIEALTGTVVGVLKEKPAKKDEGKIALPPSGIIDPNTNRPVEH